jgi:hypothetical protein
MISSTDRHHAPRAGRLCAWLLAGLAPGMAQAIDAYAAGKVDEFKSYLAGYLTAYNAMTKDVYQATGQRSTQDNLAELGKLCAGNPMDSYERAIQALIAKSATEQRETNADAAWGRPAPAK